MVTDHTELMAAAARAQNLNVAVVTGPTDHNVQLNGINFHYLDWGNEHLPHLVLLHGGSLTAHTWDMAALMLRDKYHLVALDQRGHGDTDWTPDAQLTEDNNDLMLEDTRQFIEHLGYEHLSLVGMSMGGMNTIRYSARHSERLDAVGIVDIAPETMREGQLEMEAFRNATETLSSFDDFLNRAVQFMPHRPVDHLRYSLTNSLKPTTDGWTWKQDHRPRPGMQELTDEQRQAENAQRAEMLWADVKAIERPVMLFKGADSKILSQEAAEATVAAMHDARLVVIPRATHNVHSDNPTDFARELDGFLSDVLPKA